MVSPLEAALGGHRALTILSLIALSVLAWAWLLAGAGMAMDPLVSLSPLAGSETHGAMMAMERPASGSSGRIGIIVAMWWVMMVAMMLPAAAPMILLYVRASSRSPAAARPATASFLAGYLAMWAAFATAASALQLLLEKIELLAPMLMAFESRWLSAAIIMSAGIYQLSPLKNACLRQCRNPAQFLSRHFRPGAGGAFRIGLLHGAYCVGCCWLLMTLLFVGGVMNLAWIALLTLAVAAEKLLPFGRVIALIIGLAFIAWALALLM